MKGMINSNPLNFEELRHKLKVQRVAARLHSITTGHEFVQQTVAQIYKTSHHKYFVQTPFAQLSFGQNKERPPLMMEPSIEDPLTAVKRIVCRAYISVNESGKMDGMLE